MIPRLPSPSVCVIDDEKEDYGPILDALMALGLGCVHVRGQSGDPLPPKPFDALRLVFTDLHLSGQVGKAAASHTANVFKSVVSPNGGPALVVIWSKYAQDPAGDASLPPDDQPNEADLFRAELLAAEPRFQARLIMVQMPKPKLGDRPAAEDWVKALKAEIQKILGVHVAAGMLWEWERSARDVAAKVSETIITLTEAVPGSNADTEERLRLVLKLLAQQQGGPDISKMTVVRHLFAILAAIGTYAQEAVSGPSDIEADSGWLAEKVDDSVRKNCKLTDINGALMTSPLVTTSAPFVPGTVFDLTDEAAFCDATGFRVELLKRDCFEGNPDASPAFADFRSRTKPVALELSPACDFDQGHRRCATFVAGLAFPEDLLKRAGSKDAFKRTPLFGDRSLAPVQVMGLVFCARYRFSLGLDAYPKWLAVRLRLREMVTADVRTWLSGQASRVGFLYF